MSKSYTLFLLIYHDSLMWYLESILKVISYTSYTRTLFLLIYHDLAEMPSVPFLQYFVLFFNENTSKILLDLGKYYIFSQSLSLHMCIAQQVKILFFHS